MSSLQLSSQVRPQVVAQIGESLTLEFEQHLELLDAVADCYGVKNWRSVPKDERDSICNLAIAIIVHAAQMGRLQLFRTMRANNPRWRDQLRDYYFRILIRKLAAYQSKIRRRREEPWWDHDVEDTQGSSGLKGLIQREDGSTTNNVRGVSLCGERGMKMWSNRC